jgi:hypothetical protein
MTDATPQPDPKKELSDNRKAAKAAAGNDPGIGFEDVAEYYSKLAVMIGRPHTYLGNADPGSRTYTRHLLGSAPLVSIRPGRVKFINTDGMTARIAQRLGIGQKEVQSFIRPSGVLGGNTGAFNMQNGYGVSKADQDAISDAIYEKQKGTVTDTTYLGTGSVRYFDFDPKYSDYMNVVSTMTGRLYSRMSQGVVSWLPTKAAQVTPVGATNGGFFTYWAENASSVSESFSAEVGQTAIGGIVKSITGMSKEAQFFLGEDLSEAKHGGVINGAMNQISSIIGGQGGSLRASLGDALLGLNPMFPEVWKDSSFSRSYNISFKFYSPYGDPMAIYQNVYLPFTMLLSLVMPVMRSPSSYSEPFVFQMYAPGYFACDLGICTDFSFTKGGGEGLFTAQGLPRQIDVTMQVKDLYPVLAASHNNQSMLLNTDLGTFLDNLAGVSLQRSGKYIDLASRIKASLASSAIDLSTWKNQASQYMSVMLNERTGIAPYIPFLSNAFRGY